MRSSFLPLCFVLIVTANSAFGQGKSGSAPQDGPAVVPHPHKIYVDTEHNKLFWPMDKPFWVRLAASPDADAPSYLLQRVTPESNVTTDQYNQQGIALEIQGPQFIRWFNYVTKQTINLQFYSDGAPPVTKATCTGAPTTVQSQITYYGVGLHCSLASEDVLSGVDTTYLSLDNEPWTPYKADFKLDKEKPVIFRYYAVDKVGYAETPSTLRFTVDLTSPTTKHVIEGNAIGTVLSSQAKFGITSSDSLSGVAIVRARFDKQEFAPVTTGGVSVEKLPDGEHTLSYYAVDRVDNRETEHVIPFYLDRTPPTVEFKVLGDLSESGGTRYVSSRSHIQLTAQDNKIGVDKIVYSFDAPSFQTYSDPFLLPPTPGRAKLLYRASDKLNNTSQVATMPYVMDVAPPQSNYRILGTSYQQRSDFYIRKDTRIELTAVDDASGVQKIDYQADDAPAVATYSAPLAFETEGRRLLRYWSTDKVNNREIDRAVVLITDNTPPDIFANFSLSPAASGATDLPVYRRQTNLFLGATDNAAGVHKITYSINGGKETDYTTPLVLDREGTFDLLIKADDNLGNQSSKHLHFIIRG